MKSQSLIARIKKEVQKSPQKAAVLAGLFLVAIWFWAPLVIKWMPASKSRLASSEIDLAPSVGVVPQTSEPASVDDMNWRTWAKRIQENPRMRSADLPQESLDPFRKQQVTVNNDPKDDLTAPAVVVETKPDDLFVRSIIVGRKRAIARINQANYEVGDIVQSNQGVDFVVSAIDVTGVILARNGEKFDLPLKTYTTVESDKTLVMRQGSLQP